MNVTIQPAPLTGTVAVIPSKSQAHRLLICAALADGPTRILCPATSKDIDATAACLRALGARIDLQDGIYTVHPVGGPTGDPLPCGESGSTLRFLLPVAAALPGNALFRMEGRLPQRPLSPLEEELTAHGCTLTRPTPDTLALTGQLTGRDFTLAADVSSQFVSGLLFTLPLLGGGTIHLTGKIESAGYIRMTCRAMAAFGVAVDWQDHTLTVPAGGYHSPGELTVEGDWSNGAFWLCAQALGQDLTVTGLDPQSLQGDRAVVEAIAAIQAGNAVISARDIPDLVPVLAVLAAATPGTTRFCDAQRLRIKESDRIASTLALIQDLGGRGAATEDGLEIYGQDRLTGGVCDSYNDHRIAMSAAVASLVCTGPVTVTGAQAVEKSYPSFWREFARLGGQIAQEVDL